MMPNKRILQIAPTPFFSDRGCHIRIEGIVHCLNSLAYDNTVCTYHHGRDVGGIHTKRIANIKNYTQTEAGPSKYKLWADWRLLWLVVRQYQQLKPSVIHAHLHEGLMIAVLVRIMFFWRRTPVIADMQGSLTGELDSHGAFEKMPVLKYPTHFLERVLMWMADYIVCSSRHSMKKIATEFNLDASKIALVQDGANQPTPLSNEQLDQLRKDLGLPDNKVLVVYSGALLNSKGLLELQQIIQQSSGINSHLHFLIIGYPTISLEAFLVKHGLENVCTLTGRVEFEKLPGYLSLANIALDTKNSAAGEGSGKMLNYLACGLPVVAFSSDNNRDFLPKGAPLASSIDQILAQLQALIDDADLRKRCAAANFAQFKQHYSWKATEQQLADVYKTLLG